MAQTPTLSIPFYVWPLALVAGVGISVASLSYAPEGRINVLWVWLLWAALPLLGSVAALCVALFGSARPWLFQWRNKSVSWFPTHEQRLHMLWLVQLVWCVVALGMILGYWVLLLFSDLAFGWSSTLVQDADVIARVVEWLAAPWSGLWPAAVPEADLITATYYQRITPKATEPALAGQWWRFLMASLVFYNFLPRVLLALVFYGRWRWGRHPQLEVRTSAQPKRPKNSPHTVEEDTLDHWHDAVRLSWEVKDSSAAASFGLLTWAEDEQTIAQVLAQHPKRLLWQVEASRSPVAELSDLMARASTAGVKQQALWARPSNNTDPARHLASWRAFAHQHKLVWITENDA